MSHIRFTTHKAVEDAFDALLLLAHLTKEDGHYSSLVNALRYHVREQRDMISMLSSQVEKEIPASGDQHYEPALPPQNVGHSQSL